MYRFHFIASKTIEAKKAKLILMKKYGHFRINNANIIVVLGGDGTMLKVLRDYINIEKPIYGMHFGSVGFLMNAYKENNLKEIISSAKMEEIHPLYMIAKSKKIKRKIEAIAINEISIFRQSYQAAKINIFVDDMIRMKELICDGVMVATPAGSTAYNLSAQGPILPLTSSLMALTPVSPFRPRRWRSVLLPNNVTIRFNILESKKRPVNVSADNIEVKSVTSVFVKSDFNIKGYILFDKNHSWNDRILTEQFLY